MDPVIQAAAGSDEAVEAILPNAHSSVVIIEPMRHGFSLGLREA